jgi:hypothetical protein
VTEYTLYIGIASLALALIVHAVRVTWQVRGIETEVRAFMDAQIDNLQRDIRKIQQVQADRADGMRHDTGEMGSALRSKIHEVEMFVRDKFVSKDSFELVIARLEKSMEKLGDKIEDKLDRWVERLQTKQD